VAEATRRILRELLAKSAAVKYNWDGKGDKSSFRARDKLVAVVKG